MAESGFKLRLSGQAPAILLGYATKKHRHPILEL